MGRPFRDAVVRAGLDPATITPHTLRHTAITRLVQAGVDLPTVQRISGHRTLAMVLRYSHVSAPQSTRRSRHSNTAEPGLHQNYTRRPGLSLDQNSFASSNKSICLGDGATFLRPMKLLAFLRRKLHRWQPPLGTKGAAPDRLAKQPQPKSSTSWNITRPAAICKSARRNRR